MISGVDCKVKTKSDRKHGTTDGCGVRALCYFRMQQIENLRNGRPQVCATPTASSLQPATKMVGPIMETASRNRSKRPAARQKGSEGLLSPTLSSRVGEGEDRNYAA